MLLTRLYLQLGVFLDYLTGEHEPSLSARLRIYLGTALRETPAGYPVSSTEIFSGLIPEHHPLFPQLGVLSDWPPTFLCHGALDTAVPVYESRNMQMLLEEAGVQVRLDVFDGEEHSFDYGPHAEEMYGAHFDLVGGFLKECLNQA
jgi:acetyl esterase/lipase